MEMLNVKLTSISGMIMHSAKLADPLSPESIEHKKLTSIRKKTDDVHKDIARSEFMASLYWWKENKKANIPGEVYIPSINIRACIIAGAKLNKLGMAISRGVMMVDQGITLEYDGPPTKEGLWDDEDFRDVRGVVVGGKRIMRYRPYFPKWSLDVDIQYDEAILTEAELISCIKNSGTYVGLGDFRPAKGGVFGRFDVTNRGINR